MYHLVTRKGTLVRRTTHAALAAVAVAAVATSGCGGDAGAPAASSAGTVATNGQTATVQAIDNSFSPKELTVSAGTEVVWENRGRNEHNIIPENEDDPWRVDTADFQPGETATWVFTQPGTYRYYCSIHGTINAGMPGVIIVQ